jgi:O-antigen/teichoic acid export membrane protein
LIAEQAPGRVARRVRAAASRVFPFDARIRTNAGAKLSGELVGRTATFAVAVYAAQRLGAADFGLYSYAVAVGFVAAQISDLGLQTLITREVAVLEARARPLVRTALVLKVDLSVVPALTMVAVSIGRPSAVALAFLCFGAAMILQTFAEFAAYVFRGQQNLRREAALLTVTRLGVAALGAAALALGGGLLAFALATLGATAAGAGAGLLTLHVRGWLAERAASLRDTARVLLPQALPLGVAIFLSIGFTRIAVLLLEQRSGEVDVAQFSAAQRIIEATQVLPFAVLAAVFPALSLALRDDRERARRLVRSTILWLAVVGGGFAVAIWLAAPWLMPRLYGADFSGSVDVVRILALSIVPAYVNYVLTHFLIARNQQVLSTVFVGAMFALHGALAWVLIPEHGAVGPAISYVAAEFVLMSSCLAAIALTAPRRRQWP